MLIVFIKWLHKIEIINHLGTDGSMSSNHHQNMFRTMLQCGSYIFDCKCTHTHNHNSFSLPVYITQLVVCASCNNT